MRNAGPKLLFVLMIVLFFLVPLGIVAFGAPFVIPPPANPKSPHSPFIPSK